MATTIKWSCSDCGGAHRTKPEDKYLCPLLCSGVDEFDDPLPLPPAPVSPPRIIKWSCSDCGSIHETQEDRRYCPFLFTE